jgi:hypothetical protein
MQIKKKKLRLRLRNINREVSIEAKDFPLSEGLQAMTNEGTTDWKTTSVF